jgi:hypothetical protein
MPTIVIASRYCGPPASANGGYACGAVARFIDSPSEVTLRAPPPLDAALEVRAHDGQVDVHHGETLIASGRAATVDIEVPAPVSFDDAVRASERYPGFNQHPIPSCYVCSPARADGMRLFAGPVEGRDIAATPWIPDATAADTSGLATLEHVWAALDCPSYFGIYAAHGTTPYALLGRLAARVAELPKVGERCVVLGWCTERDGRKHHAGSALYSEERGLLAAARATWITIAK